MSVGVMEKRARALDMMELMADNAEKEREEGKSNNEWSDELFDAFQQGKGDEDGEGEGEQPDSDSSRMYKRQMDSEKELQELEKLDNGLPDGEVDEDGKLVKKSKKQTQDDDNLADDEEFEEVPKTIKRKVNGKIVEYSVEDLFKVADEKDKVLDYFPDNNINNPDSKKKSKDSSDADEESLGDLAEVAKAIQTGTEAESVEALTKLIKTVKGQKVDPNAILEQVREEQKLNSAREWFSKEFADIAGDPYLLGIFNHNDALLIQKGDKRTYQERWAETADGVREWRTGITKSSGFEKKEKAKAASERSTPDRKGSVKRSDQREISEEQENSQAIQQMGRRRGKQVSY